MKLKMNALNTKSDIIEEHERRFAYLLASDVIQKPKVSIWMILVPIIFVYFFYRLNLLNQIERALNTALKPNMADTTDGFNEIVGVIEQSSAELRRDTADKIFAADLLNPSTT